jgi:hypothetical protein
VNVAAEAAATELTTTSSAIRAERDAMARYDDERARLITFVGAAIELACLLVDDRSS